MGGAIISESGGGIIPLQTGGIIQELGGGFLRNQHTGLKKPVRARCASPRASLRSVFWVASDLSAW